MVFDKELYDKIIQFGEYIASKQWMELKEERLNKDLHCCVRCKGVNKLTCHHLYYGRLYQEKIDDVITLCSKCHTWIHSVSPPKGIPLFCKQVGLEKALCKPMGIDKMQDLVKKMWVNNPSPPLNINKTGVQ